MLKNLFSCQFGKKIFVMLLTNELQYEVTLLLLGITTAVFIWNIISVMFVILVIVDGNLIKVLIFAIFNEFFMINI